MLQDASVARRVTMPAAWMLATALLFAVLASAAQAQTRAAAVGVHRASTTQFLIDGDFDGVADLTLKFGSTNEIGLLVDISGSGNRSPATFNPTTGLWRFDTNRDGVADVSIYFGGIGDKALVGDIDKDGKDDLVIYRNGTWLVSTTGNGAVTHTFSLGAYPGDIPLLGDTDGDGNLETIIFRNGIWYVSLMRNGNIDRTYRFGGASDGRDIPMVFDYDGDGKDDLVIYRNGQWYVATNPTASLNPGAPPPVETPSYVFQYGQAGDKPLYYGPGAVYRADVEAVRLLQQATFGPTQADVSQVLSMGVAAWVDAQLAKPLTTYAAMPWFPAGRPQPPQGTTWPYCLHASYTTTPYDATTPCNCNDQPNSINRCNRDVYSIFQLQKQFFVNALSAPDQLRQRVAWALSQIVVTSAAQDPIAYANRDYQQLLLNHAFGNYYDLINNVTINPFMGNYLDTVNNRKAAGTRQPNENYAREILQLFTIGLWELRADGTLLLDAFGNPIPTYDQADITELSRVYTGWVYPPLPGQTVRVNATVNYNGTMVPLESEHDTGAKRILDLGTIGAGLSTAWDASTANLTIFNHPNVGPFIGKQLIQQLVTSNPSPAYVSRIAAVFANNGSGVRGDLKAVVRAILLDPEARKPRNPVVSQFGKLKEPVLFVTNLLRALGATSDGVDPIVRTSAMGQNVYTSPTVFNYYLADYVVPGTELAGPPFNILDATTYFARSNWVYNQVTLGASCTGSICGPNPDATVVNSAGTKIDYASLQALAGDPAALVDRVNLLLFQNTMTPFMRQQIINAVAAYSATDTINRARTAVYLAAVSPRYQTEF